jgi:glycerophosphoryl diester phosphodiesterase
MQVVVFHDADLERMTGVKGRIADCAYSELPSIRLDPEEHWGVTDENRRLATRIPLLSEVLEVIPPELPIIIEFKQCHKVSALRGGGPGAAGRRRRRLGASERQTHVAPLLYSRWWSRSTP